MLAAIVLFSIFTSIFATHPGHMLPLGSHRPPSVTTAEFTEPISPKKFWEDFVSSGTPAIFRSAAANAPAFTAWTDEYLAREYGDTEIRLEAKVEDDPYVPRGDVGMARDTLRYFISRYHHSNIYAITELPDVMYKEINVLPCMNCGSFLSSIQEVNLWISGGGTASILHRDAFHAINCLYNGTKEWILIHPDFTDNVYMVVESEFEVGGRSEIDVHHVDLNKFPKFSDVTYSKFTLHPGDCLFLPGGYLHQVRSAGTHNLAVSVLFHRVKSYDDSDCSGPTYLPLSEYDVIWKYNGSGLMSMGNADIEDLRTLMLSFKDEEGKVKTSDLYENFNKMWNIMPEPGRSRSYERTAHIFAHLDPERTGYITESVLKALTRDELKEVVLAIEPAEPINTYEYEYALKDAEDIRILVEDLADKRKLTRENFVKEYMREDGIYGTEKFANMFFDELDKEEKGHVDHMELLDGRLHLALLPYRVHELRESTMEGEYLRRQDEHEEL